MADLKVKFLRYRVSQPVLAGVGAADEHGRSGDARVRRRMGRCRMEDNRRAIQTLSSRYGAIDFNGMKMMGLNNIELISDRPIEVNLREIAEVRNAIPNIW